MAAQVPLPAGWEAKYDPGQRRYFFINHTTKKTTWEDPRLNLQPSQPSWNQASPYLQRSQQPSPRQSTENIAMHDMGVPKWQKDIENKYNIRVSTMGVEEGATPPATPENQHRAASSQESAVDDAVSKLKKMFPTAPEWAVKNALFKFEQKEARAIASLEQSGYQKQSAQSQLRENNLVNKLKKEFPSAEDGVIRDVIQCVDQNESRARQELKALGYKHNSLHDVAPSQPKKKTSTTSLSTSSRASPAKSSSSSSQVEPAEAEKERLKKRIAAEFPGYPPSTIDMVLSSTKYNEDKIKRLLDTMSKQEASKKKTTPREVPRAASPAKPKPWETSSSSSSSSSALKFNMPEFNIPTASAMGSKNKKASSSSRTTTSAQKNRVQTKGSAMPKNRGAQKTSRNTRPIRTQYVSANRTQAKGPDASLAQGPDLDHLIDDYAFTKGPDPEIRKGPNPSLVEGTMLAMGPDPILAEGPDMSIRCGADPELLAATITTTRPPLVTAL